MSNPLPFIKEKWPKLQDIMNYSPCPACGYNISVSFYSGGYQTLTTLAWPKSETEAQSLERLPLNFVCCVDCGHVFNRDFDYQKVPYSEKPNLMFNKGALWKEHLSNTLLLLARRLPENPVIIEIGAGDGHFLKALAKLKPNGRYIAFDPNGSLDATDNSIEFRSELFIPEKHLLELKPDLVLCRHVLEHLTNPLEFVQALSFVSQWAGLQTSFFVEVPCIDRVFHTDRITDFFYEHCSHFTTRSLERLLQRSNVLIETINRGYDDEVIYALVRLGQVPEQKRKAEIALDFHARAQETIGNLRIDLEKLLSSGKKVAIWGGTGKSAAFINCHSLDKERFPVVVDSDLDKVGTFVPGVGQKIESPSYLLEHPTDIIIITTQWRAQDIALEIQEKGITFKQLLLAYQGRLVDFYKDEHPYKLAKASSSKHKCSLNL